MLGGLLKVSLRRLLSSLEVLVVLSVSITRKSSRVRGVENRDLGTSELRSLEQNDLEFSFLQKNWSFVTVAANGGRLKFEGCVHIHEVNLGERRHSPCLPHRRACLMCFHTHHDRSHPWCTAKLRMCMWGCAGTMLNLGVMCILHLEHTLFVCAGAQGFICAT